MPSPLIRTSLALHPEMALHVGLVVAEYAVIERLMFDVYALIVSSNPTECYRRFYKLRSLHRRCELVSSAANERNLSAVLQRLLKRLLRRIESAANRRTEIAHCVFLADPRTLVTLRMVRGEPTPELMSAAIFTRTFKQFYELENDLLTFITLIAGSMAAVLPVTRAMPRPPELEIGDVQGRPQHVDEEEAKASLKRLGLTIVEANELISTALRERQAIAPCAP